MMPLLKSCCCWRSVRSGSIASGIYTAILYSVLFIVGTYHICLTDNPPALLAFSIVFIILSAICVIFSILLLIALSKKNTILLIPWLVSVSIATFLDIGLSFFIIKDAIFDPFLAILFIIDLFICALNVSVLNIQLPLCFIIVPGINITD
ncbi:uncharacterized protein LOC111641989 [Centruroides sculpturatus]|uniref:uncharacterized protein LOC111641989 n=1 Tax=Centruroides sculpturatus TaxID=218467 RepID=UPI000C6EBA07|nr:uncharacterized protein LOC111641989 [Centruroides sculpturatus]